ncbi:MFS transporter [Stutzerimonas degradans]|uniref:MFS transporter n=1 Tax=Stutzerimonas degradans TaxID=2968968 RepID=UPI0013F4D92C|nr:MFS transporter [Stutzerimonas degradans]NHC12075.1 MFS transporter [Stutzerimonas degradans]
MSALPTTADLTSPLARHATRCGFFMAGFGLSVWAPLVPYVRARIEMSDALFGLLLLCIGLGSLGWMPVSGVLVARWGIRPVILCCVALLALALAGMALVDSIWLLALALFCFGGSLGVLDIVLNIQSLLIEGALGRRLMSNFHGMFSLGSISGALALTALLSLGLSAEAGCLLMIVLIVAANLAVLRGFVPDRAPAGSGAFVRPSGQVLLVGLLCFVVYLAEGAVLDWSALFLTTDKNLETAKGGLGYASFALMVTIGRFAGAPIVNSLGTARTIALGGVLAAMGIALSIFAEHWALALVGYGLCGLGCANVSPVLISSLSRQDAMPVHLAVTAATTVGFAGVLAGPALIGLIAHYSSLAVAFGLLSLLLLSIAFGSRRFAD